MMVGWVLCGLLYLAAGVMMHHDDYLTTTLYTTSNWSYIVDIMIVSSPP